MDYFVNKSKNADEKLPSWVDRKNSSFNAFRITEELYFDRLAYIRSHNRKSHFKNKKSFQITGTEVAIKIGISKTTLLVSSSYSENFKIYLNDTNERLKSFMLKRVLDSKNSLSRGAITRPKKMLVEDAEFYKKRMREVEERNAIDQVEIAFGYLHINVRKLLQLESPNTRSSVKNVTNIMKNSLDEGEK